MLSLGALKVADKGMGICTSRTKKSPLVETTGFTGSYRNLLDYPCRHCRPFLLCFRMCVNSQPVSSSRKPALSIYNVHLHNIYIYVYRYIQFRMSIWWKWCNWSISFKISWPSVEQSMKHETSWNMTDEINAPKQNHFQFWRHSKVRPGHGLCNLRPIAPVGRPEARESKGIGGHGEWGAKHLGFLESLQNNKYDIPRNIGQDLHEHDLTLLLSMYVLYVLYMWTIWTYFYHMIMCIPIYPWCPPWNNVYEMAIIWLYTKSVRVYFKKSKVPSCEGICNKAFLVSMWFIKVKWYSPSQGTFHKMDLRFAFQKKLITTHFITSICLYDEPFMQGMFVVTFES